MTEEFWTDENGERVEFIPFFSELYRDDISRGLDSKYILKTCSDYCTFHTGKPQEEHFLGELFRICKTVGYFVGFKKEDLDAYDNFHNAGLPDSFLRLKKVKGIEVLFLTEETIRRIRTI